MTPAWQTNRLIIIILAALLLLFGIVFNQPLHQTPFSWAEYLILLTAYLLTGWPVLRQAFTNLTEGRLFDESFLMAIATLGAIAIHQLPEAAAVMLFYTIGEHLQDQAVDRSRDSITALLAIQPALAHLQLDGKLKQVKPETVAVGQTVLVKPGERLPLDGTVSSGNSFVDASALTGESRPRSLGPGDTALAGMINGSGLLTIKVTKPFRESTVARILQLVESAAERKAPTEQFITTFAHYYTPAVVAAAGLLAVLPPLLIAGASWSAWIYRALVLLVIACPCALLVSIPLGFFVGVGAAARHGILVKGANYLDGLNHLHTVVFDKTGTLTRGVFRVCSAHPANGFSELELLAAAAAAEFYSTHPIAQSVRAAYPGTIAPNQISAYHEFPGYGISALVNGRKVLVGNDRLLHHHQVAHELCLVGGTDLHVVIDGIYAGYLMIADQIREDAPATIAGLRSLGVKQIVMLTGDQPDAAETVAAELQLDGFYAGLLPQEKVDRVEALQLALDRRQRSKLAFVGDGINDAPVIARADIGVAMGGLGSDAAIAAADLVLMEDRPAKLVSAVKIARATRRVIRQNIAMALAVKGIFVLLGGLGVATIWEAVFADVGVALVAVFNAAHALAGSVPAALK